MIRNSLLVLAGCFILVLPITAQNYPDQNNRPYANQDNRAYDRNGNYPDQIPAGTQVKVRTNDTIDVRDRANGRVYTGTVAEDVRGDNGNVVIPRGANAELVVTNLDNNNMSLDLESVTVNGRRYMVNATAYNRARHTGLGENKRTGEYVGGGALLGTIVGAIAGGGKGAAIGALAGAGAGAGGQVLTRGRAVRVPAESVLTFRLDQPLELGRGNYSRDNGYDRDGYHYHDDYYDSNRDRNRDQNRQYAPPPPPPQQ